MSQESWDVVVVGAGIVGAAVALRCARSGMRVLVLEEDQVATGVTAAGMGHLVAMDDSAAQIALCAVSLSIWRSLRNELSAGTAWRDTGTLWVAKDDEELELARQRVATYDDAGVQAEVIGADELKKLEPQLRPGLTGALKVPQDAVLYPPCAAADLLRLAQQHGATLRAATPVQTVHKDSVELASGGAIAARDIVVAAGLATRDLLQPYIDLPLEPKKGHLAITDRYPELIRHQLVGLSYLKSAHGGAGDSVAFNVQPRETGQLLIGSSRQVAVATHEVELPMVQRMLREAQRYLPCLESLSVTRCWTGHRPASPDHLPYIGAVPGAPSIHVAAGHEGLGITTATATAELLACELQGTRPSLDPEPYSLKRITAEPEHG